MSDSNNAVNNNVVNYDSIDWVNVGITTAKVIALVGVGYVAGKYISDRNNSSVLIPSSES